MAKQGKEMVNALCVCARVGMREYGKQQMGQANNQTSLSLIVDRSALSTKLVTPENLNIVQY